MAENYNINEQFEIKEEEEEEEEEDKTGLENRRRLLETIIENLIVLMEMSLERIKIYLHDDWDNADCEAIEIFLDTVAQDVRKTCARRAKLFASLDWQYEDEIKWTIKRRKKNYCCDIHS
jgi:hypothetical protein